MPGLEAITGYRVSVMSANPKPPPDVVLTPVLNPNFCTGSAGAAHGHHLQVVALRVGLRGGHAAAGRHAGEPGLACCIWRVPQMRVNLWFDRMPICQGSRVDARALCSSSRKCTALISCFKLVEVSVPLKQDSADSLVETARSRSRRLTL